jgi:hypothetical protein
MLKPTWKPTPTPSKAIEFLTMAEAAEVVDWSTLQVMNEQAGDQTITELVTWALPDPATPLLRRLRRRQRTPRRNRPIHPA